MNKIIKALMILISVMMLFACDQPGQVSSSSTGQMVAKKQNVAEVALGQKVFQKYCSVCHGIKAEGDANWRKTKPNGRYPPPPLDGNGHAWHHPRSVLRDVIMQGSKPEEGDMPGWKGKLSDAEIEAVISWFQSIWPEPVYAAWYEMHHR